MKNLNEYKDYYEFETELLEDSKENIIYRLWFAEKQLANKSQKANETLAMYLDEKSAFEDRKLFVRNLGKLLSQTRNDVESCELDDNEIVTIHFKGGYTKKVNVNMDSYSAIVRDVSKHCG